MGYFSFLILLLGTAAIIAGTAINWHVYRTTAVTTFDSGFESERSAFQYWNLCFVYAALATWGGFIAEWRGWKSQENRRHLFYGLLFFIAVQSKSSFKTVDDYRFAVQNNSTVPGAFPFAPTFSYNESIKLLAGAIINYFGLILLVLLNHGAPTLRCLNLATFFFLFSVAANVVGIIILWNLPVMSHVDTGSPIFRDIVFTQIATPQTFLLLILFGSIFFAHVDGANASMVFLAGYGMWYLAQGFEIKYIWEVQLSNHATTGGTTAALASSKVWAGSLLCWISAWLSILSAQFATINFNNRDGEAPSKSPVIL